MNTMSAMITTQYLYIRNYVRKVPTHKCVSISTPVTEKDLELLVFSLHSLSTNNRIKNRLPSQSYNLLYQTKTAKTLDLTDSRIYTQLSIKYTPTHRSIRRIIPDRATIHTQ